MRNPKCLAGIALLVLALCAGVSHAGDKEDVVGRWDHPLGGAAYYRFNADGTFKSVALLGSVAGNYKVLAGGIIELDTPGVFYGRNKTEVKYRLDGDTLELKFDWLWIGYKRVK